VTLPGPAGAGGGRPRRPSLHGRDQMR